MKINQIIRGGEKPKKQQETIKKNLNINKLDRDMIYNSILCPH